MKAVRIARRVVIVRCAVDCRTGCTTWSGSYRDGACQVRSVPSSYSGERPYACSGSISRVLLYLGKSRAAGPSRRMSVSVAGRTTR